MTMIVEHPSTSAHRIECCSCWTAHSEDRKMKAKVGVQLNAAVRKGVLTREPCIECGDYGQGHHEDYSKPLEVIWLCSLHHKRRHIEVKA